MYCFLLVESLLIIELNEIGKLSSVDMFLNFQWVDERLIGVVNETVTEYPISTQLWYPDFAYPNSEGGVSPVKQAQIIYPNGTVQLVSRSQATLRLNFDYLRYPLDQQTMNLELEFHISTADEVVYIPEDAYELFSRFKTADERHPYLISKDTRFTYSPFEIHYSIEKGVSHLNFTWTATRIPTFYIINNVFTYSFYLF